MSSKADYLKRYASKDKDSSDTATSNPEKKRRKKSRIADGADNRAAGGVTMVDVDLSWDAVAPSSGQIDNAWERVGAEEDAPVVVNMATQQEEEPAYVSRGTWVEGGSVSRTSEQSSSRLSPSASPPRRRGRGSAPSASPPRRRARGSSPSASPPRRRARGSSPSASPPRRRARGSSPSASPPRKGRHSEEEQGRDSGATRQEFKETSKRRGGGRVETTSTGHRAGLQSAEDLIERGKDLERQRQEEVEEAKRQQAATGTVYRDRRGKKLDMLNEFMRNSAAQEGKEQKMKEAMYEWGRGAVQKEKTQQTMEELRAMADAPFARTIDDVALEKEKKSIIRDGDPMAEYFNSIRDKTEQEVAVRMGKPLKQRYRGPAPAPNRFGIAPGYRWDAIDRGNAYESGLLKKVSDRGSLKEDEYRWSTADM